MKSADICSNVKASKSVIYEVGGVVSTQIVEDGYYKIKNGYKVVTLNFEADAINNLFDVNVNIASITSLALPNCDLQLLPNCLEVLALKELDISYNNFSNVPSCLETGLKFLEILNMSHNNLQRFEFEPKCVKKLKVLNVNCNKLTNIPEWILLMKCCNLENLYYSDNYVVNLNTSSFIRVTGYNLKKLELKNCGLINEDFPFLRSISSLEELNLSNEKCRYKENKFIDLSELFVNADFYKLQVLKLSNLSISFLPDNICTLPVLKELHLSDNNIFWLPDLFVTLKSLTLLDVSGCNLVYLPSDIKKMDSLQIIKASFNALTSVPDVSYLKNLILFDLYHNDLTEININISVVKFIDVERNYFDTTALGEDYIKRRDALRGSCLLRDNGPRKEVIIDNVSSCTKTSSLYSDYSDVENFKDEEEWNTDYCNKGYNSGCTLSDQEWVGYEKNLPKYKAVKNMVRYPSYLFVDATE